jgi:hypothetical protein
MLSAQLNPLSLGVLLCGSLAAVTVKGTFESSLSRRREAVVLGREEVHLT